jgi:hypothetical protein
VFFCKPCITQFHPATVIGKHLSFVPVKQASVNSDITQTRKFSFSAKDSRLKTMAGSEFFLNFQVPIRRGGQPSSHRAEGVATIPE